MGILWISSDRADQMGPKIKTPKNPYAGSDHEVITIKRLKFMTYKPVFKLVCFRIFLISQL